MMSGQEGGEGSEQIIRGQRESSEKKPRDRERAAAEVSVAAQQAPEQGARTRSAYS